MTMLFFLHGGDLPSWVINLIFYSFFFIPVFILIFAVLLTYKISNNNEKKESKDRKEKQ